jgi:hypothetical protein
MPLQGFRGRAKNVWRIARQRVEKALVHAYRGRKEKKRTYRALWIARINAGTREHGVSWLQGFHQQALPHSANLCANLWASAHPRCVPAALILQVHHRAVRCKHHPQPQGLVRASNDRTLQLQGTS